MFIVEPNDTPNDAETLNPADAVMAAMDQGIAEATPEQDATPVEPVEPTDAAGEGAPEGDGGEPVATADGTTPPKDGETPADPTPAEEDPAAKDAAEADSLGLKGKSNERFRELTAEVRELSPLREAMKEVGYTDVRQAAEALGRVRTADDIVGRLVDTGSNVEQFDKTLEYLGHVNRGMRGDRAALKAAWDLMAPEVTLLVQTLGIDPSSLADPLAGHDDLIDEVESGNLTRARAREIAATRKQNEIADSARKAEAQQHETVQRQQQEHAQAVASGKQALNDLGARLSAADPASFQARGPALKAAIADIAAKYPPSEWVARTLEVYATLPVPTAAAPAARAPAVGHVPVRPTGGRPHLEPAVYEDPMDALNAGIAAGSL